MLQYYLPRNFLSKFIIILKMPSALWDRDYRKETVISVESGESDISLGFAIDLWSSVQTIPFEPFIPLPKVYALIFNSILILFPQMVNR